MTGNECWCYICIDLSHPMTLDTVTSHYITRVWEHADHAVSVISRYCARLTSSLSLSANGHEPRV